MCFSFSILGGPRPHAPSAVRQNVTEAICQVDSQIVAWPAVKGHRRRHTHRLRKSNRCDTKANIIFQLKMRDSVIVNLTNGGKNGITIRLHGFGHRRLDQGAARYSCKFLLDYDGNRYGKGDEGKSRRNYFPDYSLMEVKGLVHSMRGYSCNVGQDPRYKFIRRWVKAGERWLEEKLEKNEDLPRKVADGQ